MIARLTGAEVESAMDHFTHNDTHPRAKCLACFREVLVTQLDADAAELAALRGEAAEWRAVKQIMNHEVRRGREAVSICRMAIGSTRAECYIPGDVLCAETPVALLARLDELAEAAKPKAEVWRMRHKHGEVSHTTATSAEGIRAALDTWQHTSHPVRELRNPRGHVLLLPEGEPIPSEGGPWG